MKFTCEPCDQFGCSYGGGTPVMASMMFDDDKRIIKDEEYIIDKLCEMIKNKFHQILFRKFPLQI